MSALDTAQTRGPEADHEKIKEAGLELINLPASAYQVQGIKACNTTPSFFDFFLFCY